MLFPSVPFVLPDSERGRFAGSSEELDSDDGERDIEGAAAGGGGKRGVELLHRAQRKNMRGQFASICPPQLCLRNQQCRKKQKSQAPVI